MPQPTLILDVDSTLLGVETLDELARLALDDHPDKEERMAALEAITRAGMSGELPFDESLDHRLRLFHANRGHVEALTKLLFTVVSPSALEKRDWFGHNCEAIYVVSGGFEDYILPITDFLGILATHVFANRFLYDEDGEITGYDPTRLLSKADGKVSQVAELELPRPIIVVGDGATDYQIKQRGEADEFWVMTETVSRENVVPHADKVLTSFFPLPQLFDAIMT